MSFEKVVNAYVQSEMTAKTTIRHHICFPYLILISGNVDLLIYAMFSTTCNFYVGRTFNALLAQIIVVLETPL